MTFINEDGQGSLGDYSEGLFVGDVCSTDIGKGTLLNDRYRLDEVLGEGGMGVVYKALDLRKDEVHASNPYVAIKLLNDHVRSMTGAAMALQREAMLAQSLIHKSIATIYDYNRDKSTPYIVMELVEGGTLDQFIMTDHPDGLPRSQAFTLIQSLILAVRYAHGKGVVHADIKPSNIKIQPNGSGILMDFGLARVVSVINVSTPKSGCFLTMASSPLLNSAVTPSYATQSRMSGNDPTEADDVYALGCVIYLILTGRHPYQPHHLDHTIAEPSAVRRPAALTQAQWNLLKQAINPRIDRRNDLINDLFMQFSTKTRAANRRKRQLASYSMVLGLVMGIPAIASWAQKDLPVLEIRYASELDQIPLLMRFLYDEKSVDRSEKMDSLERILLPSLFESWTQRWTEELPVELVGSTSRENGMLINLQRDTALVSQLSSLLSHNPEFMSYRLMLEQKQARLFAAVLDHYDRLVIRYMGNLDSLPDEYLIEIVNDYELLKMISGTSEIIQKDPRLYYLFSREVDRGWQQGRYEALLETIQSALRLFPGDPNFVMAMEKLSMKIQGAEIPQHASPSTIAELTVVSSDRPLSSNPSVLMSILNALIFASSNNLDLNPVDRDRYVEIRERFLSHGGSEPKWEELLRRATLEYAQKLSDIGRSKEAFILAREMVL